MKSRRKIYLSAGLAVVLLFSLLWAVFYLKHSNTSEKKEATVVEREAASVGMKPDTIPTLIGMDTITAVEEKPIATVKRSRVLAVSEKRMEVAERKDTVLPDLILAPLHTTEILAQNSRREELIVLRPVVLARKTKEEVESGWKADTLPVKRGIDLLRIKQVGRFDRGIVNYRFMPKGQTMVGLDASFWTFDSRESKLLFAYLDNFTFNARTVSINPFIGYFFKDNQAVGMKWGYKQTSGRLDNASIKIDDDVNFSLKDLGLKEEIYSCTFFHRSYIGLDAGKRFGLFNETSLNVGYGKSVFTRGADETLKETTTKILEARLGISPGLAVFIMENVSVECSIGVMGLKYRQEKQMNNLGENGKHLNGGANFKINLFDLNLGLIISL